MWSISSLTTLKLTSASSKARRISRRASPMFSSVRTACPRRDLKARCNFSERFSNMTNHYFSSQRGKSLFRRENTGGSLDGIAVDRHSVFDAASIAAGVGHHRGNTLCPRHAENKFVPLLQSFDRQRQAAELVFAVGIGSGDVANQIGLELP